MVPPMPVAVLASQGPVWQWLTVRTNIPRGFLPRGISCMVKSKWLLGWHIYTWDAPALLPSPSGQLQPGQLPINLLELS